MLVAEPEKYNRYIFRNIEHMPYCSRGLPLPLLFNKSFKEGTVPKHGKMLTLYLSTIQEQKHFWAIIAQSRYKNFQQNTRKVIKEEILHHIISNNLLNNAQCGFESERSCVSCVLQLLEAIEDWTMSLDDAQGVNAPSGVQRHGYATDCKPGTSIPLKHGDKSPKVHFLLFPLQRGSLQRGFSDL